MEASQGLIRRQNRWLIRIELKKTPYFLYIIIHFTAGIFSPIKCVLRIKSIVCVDGKIDTSNEVVRDSERDNWINTKHYLRFINLKEKTNSEKIQEQE